MTSSSSAKYCCESINNSDKQLNRKLLSSHECKYMMSNRNCFNSYRTKETCDGDPICIWNNQKCFNRRGMATYKDLPFEECANAKPEYSMIMSDYEKGLASLQYMYDIDSKQKYYYYDEPKKTLGLDRWLFILIVFIVALTVIATVVAIFMYKSSRKTIAKDIISENIE